MMTHGHLFSGIGGFIAAAKSTGLETLFSCEIDSWLNKLLRQNYPDLTQYRDIKEMIYEKLPAVDILTASPPCQPVSQAGKRAGSRDDRFLWNETIAVIRKIRPRWFIIENVPGFAWMVEFDRELPVDAEGVPFGNVGDLMHRSGRGVGAKILETFKAEGYSIKTFDIPAAGVDALHLRHRLWIVANLSRVRGGGLPTQPGKENIDIDGSGKEVMADTYSRKRSLYWFITGMGWNKQSVQEGERKLIKFAGQDMPRRWPIEPPVSRVAYGILNRVHRIKGLGNTIVPQIAEVLFRYILEIEKKVDK